MSGLAAAVGSAMSAEEGGRAAEERAFGSFRVHRAAADLFAGGVDQVCEESQQPIRREFRVELSAALAANEQ
jgi:hypothetical protein